MESDSLIYLASPYSDPSAAVRHDRFVSTARVTLALSHRGVFVFSPILHTVPMVQVADAGHLWSDWAEVDRCWLERCDEMWILGLRGWSSSVGVGAEIDIMRELGKPVRLLDPQSYELCAMWSPKQREAILQ